MKYKYATPAKTRKPRPNTWITGPDELTHEMFYAWHKHRSQARYRKEDYDLTFDQWLILWSNPEQWNNRGRQKTCWCLTRKDVAKSWSIDNCEVITRYDQLLRNVAARVIDMADRPFGSKYQKK